MVRPKVFKLVGITFSLKALCASKVAKDDAERRQIYDKVPASTLFDMQLSMHSICSENEVYEYMNPLACRNVIQRRVKEGKAHIPLYCFVHETALKMYRWEFAGNNPDEFPMRFHKMTMDGEAFR